MSSARSSCAGSAELEAELASGDEPIMQAQARLGETLALRLDGGERAGGGARGAGGDRGGAARPR